jgi:hypothetical protein
MLNVANEPFMPSAIILNVTAPHSTLLLLLLHTHAHTDNGYCYTRKYQTRAEVFLILTHCASNIHSKKVL